MTSDVLRLRVLTMIVVNIS